MHAAYSLQGLAGLAGLKPSLDWNAHPVGLPVIATKRKQHLGWCGRLVTTVQSKEDRPATPGTRVVRGHSGLSRTRTANSDGGKRGPKASGGVQRWRRRPWNRQGSTCTTAVRTGMIVSHAWAEFPPRACRTGDATSPHGHGSPRNAGGTPRWPPRRGTHRRRA